MGPSNSRGMVFNKRKGLVSFEFLIMFLFILISFFFVVSVFLFTLERTTEAFTVWRVARVSSIIKWDNTVGIRNKADLYSPESLGNESYKPLVDIKKEKFGDKVANSLESAWNIKLMPVFVEPPTQSKMPEYLYSIIKIAFGKENADKVSEAWINIYPYIQNNLNNLNEGKFPDDLKEYLTKTYGENISSFIESIWPNYIYPYVKDYIESIYSKVNPYLQLLAPETVKDTDFPTEALIEYKSPALQKFLKANADYFYWKCPGKPKEVEDGF